MAAADGAEAVGECCERDARDFLGRALAAAGGRAERDGFCGYTGHGCAGGDGADTDGVHDYVDERGVRGRGRRAVAAGAGAG